MQDQIGVSDYDWRGFGFCKADKIKVMRDNIKKPTVHLVVSIHVLLFEDMFLRVCMWFCVCMCMCVCVGGGGGGGGVCLPV